MNGVPWRDIRYALRSLSRDRAFAFLVVCTLALGIGAATAMFSIFYGIAVRATPVEQDADVVVMWTAPPMHRADHLPVNFADLQVFQQRTRALRAVAGVSFQGAVDVVMLDAERAVPLAATWVTGGFFPLLGITPLHGRTLQATDDTPGAAPVMVISHAFWRDQFGGSPDVIGSALIWQGRRVEVVGVLPRGFEYPKGVQAWLPVMPSFPATADASETSAGAMVFDLVGRLRPGYTVRTARADFDAFLRAGDVQRPAAKRGMTPVVLALRDRIAGEVRPALWAALAVVVLLLLIACANVSSLLLIRTSTRAHEIAIRVALGAGRWQLVRQLLTETGVLSLAGGLLGTGLAMAAVRVLVALAPPELPQRELIGIDANVLSAALGITITAMMLCGLVPAVLATGDTLGVRLRNALAAPTDLRTMPRLRHALVVGQVALSVIVVISAGLVLHSGRTLARLDMGFNHERLLVFETTLPASAIPDHARLIDLQEAMIARVSELPDVLAASTMPKLPFAAQGGWLAMYSGDGQSVEGQANNPWANFEVVGPGYFRTLELPVMRGRAFDENDHERAAPVAIVSEAIARRIWPGIDPIGKRLKLGTADGPGEWIAVVGVVGDTRYHELTSLQPSLYLPTRQFGGPVPMTLAVRTRSDDAHVIAQVRAVLRALHPDLMIARGGAMSQLLAAPLAGTRFASLLLGTFAMVTLFLALVGMYAALAFAVRQRSREIGIRLALGASASMVRGLVLRQALRLAAMGCALGIGVALMTSRFLRSLLYATSATDPVTYLAVTALVLSASALASWLPALRAGRVNPMQMLRSS